MSTSKKKPPSPDQSDPKLRERNERFKQVEADSLDHVKQSGRGKGDNKLPKPAGSSD